MLPYHYLFQRNCFPSNLILWIFSVSKEVCPEVVEAKVDSCANM